MTLSQPGKINLNQSVRAELTPYGLKQYNLYRGRYQLPPVGNPVFKGQLWDFMSIFGNMMILGGPQIIEDNLLEIEPEFYDNVAEYHVKDGKLHATDRPALVMRNGTATWYINGNQVDPLVAMVTELS